jgi:hypothetical protein
MGATTSVPPQDLGALWLLPGELQRGQSRGMFVSPRKCPGTFRGAHQVIQRPLAQFYL